MDCRLELKTVAVRKDGCFSVLLWDDRPLCVSVERTFEDDLPIICNGYYKCGASRYIKGGYDTFEIYVDGHSRILFHKGNTELDSIGCVVLGSYFVWDGEVTKVALSADAFQRFINVTKGLEYFNMQVTGR